MRKATARHGRRSIVFSVLMSIVGLLSAGLVGLPTIAGAAVSTAQVGQFVPLPTQRVVDTTNPAGVTDDVTGYTHTGKLKELEYMNYDFLGHGGVPTSGVLAVVVHLTTLNGDNGTNPWDGYVWAYPATSGTLQPDAANDPHPPTEDAVANSGQGYRADNTAIVLLGDGGQVSFYNGPVSNSANSSDVDLFVDVEGYITDGTGGAGASYQVLSPMRIVNGHTLTSAAAWPFTVTGVDGMPTTASYISAVAINLGASGATQNCSVAATTNTASDPAAVQKVHTYANGTAQQLVMVQPNSSGQIYLSTDCPSVLTFADVQGYWMSPTNPNGASGNFFVPLAEPQRIVDTRSNVGITGAMSANRTVSGTTNAAGSNAIPVVGVGGVPATGVSAVDLSLTTMNGTGMGWLEAWPDGTTRPSNTTSITVDSAVLEDNIDFITPGSDGRVAFYNSTTESTDLLVDLVGYFQRPVPTPPNSVSVARSGTSAYVDWTPPDDDRGLAVTSYKVTASPGGASVSTSNISAVLTGLTTGQSYTFTVTASNSAGASPGMQAAAVSASPPSADLDPTVDTSGAGKMLVSWQPPSSALDQEPNSLTQYGVKLYAASGSLVASSTETVDATTHEFSGLTAGSSYYATVQATNSFGSGGVAQSPTFTADAPDPVEDVGVDSADSQATVTWDDPDAAPTTYQVTATPTGGGTPVTSSVTGTSGSAVVSGLTDGQTYNMSVKAITSQGTTTGLATETATPLAAPSPPSAVTAQGLGGAMQVQWQDSSDPTTNLYEIDELNASGSVVASTSASPDETSAVVNDVPAGSYTTRVVSVNGNGATSSGAVSPSTSSSGTQDRTAADYSVETMTADDFTQTHATFVPTTSEQAVLTQEAAEYTSDSTTVANVQQAYVPESTDDSATTSSLDDAAEPSSLRTGCGGARPQCSNSYYLTAGTDDKATLTSFAQHERNGTRTVVMFLAGAFNCDDGVTLGGLASDCVSWNTVDKKLIPFINAWYNSRDNGHHELDLGVMSTNGGNTGISGQSNALYAAIALYQRLMPVAKNLNTKSAHCTSPCNRSYITLSGGLDVENSLQITDPDHRFNKAKWTLPWLQYFKEDISAPVGEWNNTAWFFNSCNPASCQEWTQRSKARWGWSLQDMYDAMRGLYGDGFDYSVVRAVPQEYNPGWGGFYQNLNSLAAYHDLKLPYYAGVAWSCPSPDVGGFHGGGPGAAYDDFVKATHITPSRLTRQFTESKPKDCAGYGTVG